MLLKTSCSLEFQQRDQFAPADAVEVSSGPLSATADFGRLHFYRLFKGQVWTATTPSMAQCPGSLVQGRATLLFLTTGNYLHVSISAQLYIKNHHTHTTLGADGDLLSSAATLSTAPCQG